MSNGSNSSDAYHSLDYRTLGTVVFSLLACSGIFGISSQSTILDITVDINVDIIVCLGNLLIIAVVMRVKGMKTPTHCYLVSLAAADCLLFLAAMPVELAGFHLPDNLYVFGDVCCKILSFLPYLAINASSLSITAFTVERYIGICHPMRAKYICTVKRAQIIICAIWVFSILYNAQWLFLTQVKPLSYTDWPGAETCTFKLSRTAYKAVYFFDLVSFYLIPLMLYVVLYGRIAYILMRPELPMSSKRLDTCAMQTGTCDAATTHLVDKQAHSAESRASNSAHVAKSRSQVVKMLVVIVVIFALCWLPYRGVVVYNSFAGRPWVNQWYYFFAKTMIFVNSATNPVLFNLMSAKFRDAFRQQLCCICTSATSSTSKARSYVRGRPITTTVLTTS